MSIPRNLGNFADNVTSTGTLNVSGINATGTPSASTVLAGNGSWVTPTVYAGGDATNNIGYLNIPQNTQYTNYTLVLADSGKHIFHDLGESAATYTIPANSSVSFPIGTAITFINMAASVVSIAITTDTLRLSSAGTTGTRSLAQYGSATAIKVSLTVWLISGSGLT